MKYIKLFESNIYMLKPGYMYHFVASDSPVGFIGYNTGSDYPLLCLIFKENINRKSRFDFIEWVGRLENEKDLPPLNMTIKDYIIENDIVKKTIKSLEFAKEVKNDATNRKIDIILNHLLGDADIQVYMDVDKYNL